MKILKTISRDICAETKRNWIYSLIVVSLFISFINSSAAPAKSRVMGRTRTCRSMRSIARAYMAYGYYSKAQPFAERALKLAVKSTVSDKELSMCLGDLSYIYTKQGQLEDAEEKCKLSMKLQEKVYGTDNLYVAYSLRNLGSIYRLQGRFQNAKETLKKSLAIMYKYCRPGDRELAPFYVELAKVFASIDNLQQAEEYFSKALDMVVINYGSNNLYTANVMSDLAEFYVANGSYEKAAPLAKKAQAVQERIYGTNHHLVAPTWFSQAAIHRARGQYSEADEFINRAITAVEKTGDIVAIAKLSQQAAKTQNTKALAFAGIPKIINSN